MSEVMEQMNGEISVCLSYMSTMSPDDEKYGVVADRVLTLSRAKAEIEKVEVEREDREARREIDIQHYQEEIDAEAAVQRAKNALEQEQLRLSNRNKWLDFGIAVAGIVIPVGVEVTEYVLGMDFEGHGALTSSFFRMMLNNKLFKHKRV